MKGIELLSDLFILFMLIIIVILMCGLIWAFTLIYGVESSLGLVNPRQVTLRILFQPLKYESVLLTFLELEHQEMPMKKILNVVAIQGTTDIWIDGKTIDAKSVSEGFLTEILEEKTYLLKTINPEIIIARSSTLSSSLQKVSTKLFLLDGESINLELYVG